MAQSRDMVPADSGGGMMLFGSDNPDVVINKATKVANALAKVIEARKMYTVIGQGKHLRVEAWQTLGAMTGVFAVVAWTRKCEGGWEARAEAQFRGEIIGAAECECLSNERNWSNKDDHALRSMAQTRAIAKALSGPLRFITVLAGYEGTPADEMPDRPSESRPSDAFRRPQQRTDAAAGAKPTGTPPGAGSTANKSWTGKIEQVTFREYPKKDKTTGKPTGEQGKTYSIKTKDGMTFKTWSDTAATDCKYAAENDEAMTITYSSKEYRGNLEHTVETCEPAAINEPDEAPADAVEGEA